MVLDSQEPLEIKSNTQWEKILLTVGNFYNISSNLSLHFFLSPSLDTWAVPELVSEYSVLTSIYLVSSGIPIFIALSF